MNRIIKFRAWDGEKMHTKNVCIIDGDIAIDEDGMDWSFDFGKFNGPKLIGMQFTGLTDKNGADIYDGDLLRIPSTSQYEDSTFNCFEVFYHDNECIGGYNVGFCINRMHMQGNSGGGIGYKFTPESISKHGFVVIGNIYENKELINN